MNTIQSGLKRFNRLHHALLPTPVQDLPVLSDMSGCRVFCKRDDLTGFGFGGNKARKLDYLVADALQTGCDTLLAVGAAQSNFCRMTAAYAAAEGMQAHLVLGGSVPDRLTGNLTLDHLLGAECYYTGSDDWDVFEKRSVELEHELIQKGRKVYRLPMGGSTPIGSLGYIEAMAEIMEDERRLNVQFDTIVLASSSAGTQAGLVTGKTLAEWPGKILGFSVAWGEKIHRNAVRELASQTAALFNHRIDSGSICIDDGYIGGGYARKTAACDEAVRFFARRCGIFLDYVYTGKAAAGLMDYLRSGKFKQGSTLLFLHTGGNIELFA